MTPLHAQQLPQNDVGAEPLLLTYQLAVSIYVLEVANDWLELGKALRLAPGQQ